ncbi:cytochrome P450 4F5 [Mycena latifolia]|nr:cytochrome P450 4F5 [Mycena latifolia]
MLPIAAIVSHFSTSCNQVFLWLYGISFISRTVLFLMLITATTHYQLSCPRKLRHLKRVSPYATLWSYAIRESVDQRIRRLILPIAEQGEGAVAVYMLGKWGVHLLDPALIKLVCLDPTRFPKKNYQEHLHFTFLSGPNIVFSNGEQWKRHSASVKRAFNQSLPVYVFAELAEDVLKKIGKGGVWSWTEIMQKFTLDVVGRAALGHEFAALKFPANNELPLVDHFNRVMSSIVRRDRLMFPILDTLFPRQTVIDDVQALNARYDELLAEKRGKPGRDILSYLLEDTSLSHEELASNLSILFSAGHDTTSGALSTAVYYLSIDPVLQSSVRAEVHAILRTGAEPTLTNLKALTLLDAVIKESLRINSPISLLPARVCNTDAVIGTYVLPEGVPIVPNIYAVHHNNHFHPDESRFLTGRFLSSPHGEDKEIKGGTFIPFGTGPRQCPARQFSLFEQKTLLALLLMKYEFCLPEGSEHTGRLKNEFGVFGLSVPHALDVEFREFGSGK